jgi:chemotaxis protein histidine kinase CheA
MCVAVSASAALVLFALWQSGRRKERAMPDAPASAEAEARVAQRLAEAEARRVAEVEAQARRVAEAEAQARRVAEVEAQARRVAEAEAEVRREVEADAEARRVAEAEARRVAEAEAEVRRVAEAEAEVRRVAEAEAQARRVAEAEAEVRREVEADAEARRVAEAEARRVAEAEAEVRRVAEVEAQARRVAEAEARRVAEAEAEVRREVEADAEARRIAESASAAPEATGFDRPAVDTEAWHDVVVDAKNAFVPLLRLEPGVCRVGGISVAEAAFLPLVPTSASPVVQLPLCFTTFRLPGAPDFEIRLQAEDLRFAHETVPDSATYERLALEAINALYGPTDTVVLVETGRAELVSSGVFSRFAQLCVYTYDEEGSPGVDVRCLTTVRHGVGYTLLLQAPLDHPPAIQAFYAVADSCEWNSDFVAWAKALPALEGTVEHTRAARHGHALRAPSSSIVGRNRRRARFA